MKTVSRETNCEPIAMTLTKGGVAVRMSFTPVTRDWYVSDCKRYTVSVCHSPNVLPFTAWVRPFYDGDEKYKPMAENLGAFEQLKGRDSAIAACIRHKREHSTETTTQQQELTV